MVCLSPGGTKVGTLCDIIVVYTIFDVWNSD